VPISAIRTWRDLEALKRLCCDNHGHLLVRSCLHSDPATARTPGHRGTADDSRGLVRKGSPRANWCRFRWFPRVGARRGPRGPWVRTDGPAPKGGAYTYNWIENLLALNMHSVDTVLPEFQDPHRGDAIGLGANRMRLERVEPENVLSWRSEDRQLGVDVRTRAHDRHTRLISRNRFRFPTCISLLGMRRRSLPRW
jgi:hypothetical protein